MLQVRLNKILNIKRIRINRLRELNTEAERKKSFGEPISEDFQKRYANKVIELEHLNTHLREILAQVQQHCQEVSQVKQTSEKIISILFLKPYKFYFIAGKVR